jgi:hypothetical protein
MFRSRVEHDETTSAGLYNLRIEIPGTLASRKLLVPGFTYPLEATGANFKHTPQDGKNGSSTTKINRTHGDW